MATSFNARLIDWKVLRGATDNDEAAMKAAVLIYLREGVKSVKALRDAVLSADSDRVAALAHRFLGSSRFLGAKQIGIPLEALLKMGRARCLSAAAPGLVDRTEKEFLRIDEFVKAPRG